MTKAGSRNSGLTDMRISVVVPVRNEQDSIRGLIELLLDQTLPPAEIVITDGGSSDSTPEIITEFVQRGAPVQLIREAHALPGRGRNISAARAASEWLAFIDAGTQPERDWLEALALAVKSDTDVVYGTYEPIIDSRFKICAVMAYVAPAFESEGKQIRPNSIVSVLMKRSVWEQVGGFPEHLRSAEDLLFMRKIEQASFRTVRAPDALVHWDVEPNAVKTFKRFVRYARSNMRAGLWSEWQAPLFRRYGLLLLTALPAMILGRLWLLVPVLLWLLLIAARTAVSLTRNRGRYPASTLENARRALVLGPLLAMLDVATIAGTLQWLFLDALRTEPARAGLADGA
ncbi:MAG TPA: glycosyltransferase [Pyrinomonadaceae bacterium]|nr:glycosyltransferase [Pyrinomonadaceae bacterium]